MSVETPTVSQSRSSVAISTGSMPPGVGQVGEVVARHRVGDHAGQERVGRVFGVVVLVGGEEGRQAGFRERNGPGFAEVVGAVAASSRASLRRIRRAQSSAPERIHADCVRARSAASTWIARHCCQTIEPAKRRHQGDDDHRREQRRAALAPRDADAARIDHGLMIVSRTRLPARPLPGAKPRTTRTPSGSSIFCAPAAGTEAAGAVGSATTLPVDWQLAHAPWKK